MNGYNNQSFTRSPMVEKVDKHIQITWYGHTIVDCPRGEAYWETHHQPTYYIPPGKVSIPLSKTGWLTFCEWKGTATHYSIMSPNDANHTIQNRIWSYNEPYDGFKDIKGFLIFNDGPWECYVDGERAKRGEYNADWIEGSWETSSEGQSFAFESLSGLGNEWNSF